MTVDRPPPPTEGVPENLPRQDVAEALRTLQSFSRDQAAWLMATAMRWGYELRDSEDRGYWAGYWARVAEENAAYPPQPVFQLGRWYDQAEQRASADAEALLPRLSDHAGGPVPTWGDGSSIEAAA